MNVVALAGIGDEASSSLKGQIDAHVKTGWAAIELRLVDGQWVHDLEQVALATLADELCLNCLSVCALASPIGNWARPITTSLSRELAELDAVLAAARAVKAPIVRIMSYPNTELPHRLWRSAVVKRMRAFAKRAEWDGIVLAIENCAGYAATNAARALDLIDAVGSPSLRMLFDTGNAVAYGYDGIQYLEQILPMVVHVHIKDGTPASGVQPVTFTMPGEGAVGLAGMLRALIANGYRGYLSIEPEIVQKVHMGQSAPDAERVAVYCKYASCLELLMRQLFPGCAIERGLVTLS